MSKNIKLENNAYIQLYKYTYYPDIIEYFLTRKLNR